MKILTLLFISLAFSKLAIAQGLKLDDTYDAKPIVHTSTKEFHLEGYFGNIFSLISKEIRQKTKYPCIEKDEKYCIPVYKRNEVTSIFASYWYEDSKKFPSYSVYKRKAIEVSSRTIKVSDNQYKLYFDSYKGENTRYVACEKSWGRRYCFDRETLASKSIWEDYIKKYYETVEMLEAPRASDKASITFNHLSEDGTSLIGLGKFFREEMREIGGVGALKNYYEFLLTFQIESCLTYSGNSITGDAINPTGHDIAEIITHLQEEEPRKIFKCTLKLTQNEMRDSSSSDRLRLYSNPSVYEKDKKVRLIIYNDNSFQLSRLAAAKPYNSLDIENIPQSLVYKKRMVNRPDQEVVRRAQEALRNFRELIRYDYADILYSLTDDSISFVERKKTIDQFFVTNEAKILSSLKNIREGFAHLSLLEKISISLDMKKTYNHIRAVEKQLKVLNRLDRIVRSYY